VKLLLDEMLSRILAGQLRARGYNVDAVSEREDLKGRPDPTIFEVAQSEQRVIVTENVQDFREIAADELAAGRSHAGLIFTVNARFYRGHPRITGRLVRALEGLLESGEDLTDREIWLNRV
jgi:predicted nuclease of predicted toxin-antitoxin system